MLKAKTEKKNNYIKNTQKTNWFIELTLQACNSLRETEITCRKKIEKNCKSQISHQPKVEGQKIKIKIQ